MVERSSSLNFSCSSASFCSDDESSERRREGQRGGGREEERKRAREREERKRARERRRKGDNQPLYWRTLLLSTPSLLPSPLPPCTWRVKPALQFSIFCVQSCHRLHHVLLTIFNLHCPLRLQHTPSTQTV